MPTTRRTVPFKDGREKANWLDANASADSTDPKVQALARRFESSAKSRSPGDAWRERFITDVYDFVRDSIRYRTDPGHKEEFADAHEILFKTGADDCDGKARTFVALVRAVGNGAEARVRPVFDRRGNFTHVQAETRWPGSARDARTQPNGWILAEMILRDCALGQDPETVRRVKGRRVLA